MSDDRTALAALGSLTFAIDALAAARDDRRRYRAEADPRDHRAIAHCQERLDFHRVQARMHFARLEAIAAGDED